MTTTRLLLATALISLSLPAYAAQPPGKPMPQMTPEEHQEYMKKEQDEWNSMTPEQRQAFRDKRRAEFMQRIHRKAPPQGMNGPSKFNREEKAGQPPAPAGNVPQGVVQEGNTLRKTKVETPAEAAKEKPKAKIGALKPVQPTPPTAPTSPAAAAPAHAPTPTPSN